MPKSINVEKPLWLAREYGSYLDFSDAPRPVVVTNGDAMEIRTRILHVVIAGKEISLSNKQTELFNRYMGRN